MFRLSALLLLLGTGAFFAGFSMLTVEVMTARAAGGPIPWRAILAAQPLAVVLTLCGPLSWALIAWLLSIAKRRREAAEGKA